MRIFHPWHGHPLFLSDEIKYEDYCSFCEKRFDGNRFYACIDCKFYVHKSCAELPLNIEHHFHQPHPLELCSGDDFACDSCHKRFQNELRFNCSDCDFDLDVKCALMSDIDTEEKESIQHFTHQHPLTICSKDGDNPLNCCFACKRTSSDLIYGCTPCDYFLHKSCSEISTQLMHAIHPQHPLVLSVKYGLCNYCKLSDHTWKYNCRVCDFCLDLSCSIKSAKAAQNSEISCVLCGKQHLDSDSCVDWLYFINQSFIHWPEEIKHEFHSHKPLLLLGQRDFGCDSCHKWFNGQSHYGCEECNFRMDFKCALMPSIQYDKSDESIRSVIPPHFSHQHRLQLIREVYDINCFACQTTNLSPIYGCVNCEYFLHQSCLELPCEIEHPLHDSCVLTIQPLRDNFCRICCKKDTGFSFGCIQCRFFIGIECVFELQPVVVHKYHPTVEHKYHHHLLCLIEKSYCDRCNADNSFCHFSKESSEFKLTKSYSLRCIECDYNLHLLCGPLPSTIKHKSHLHVLTLMDSMVEDYSDEYYCDICEEIRNPRLCIYYCKECKFISHVHCVISEIINALKKSPVQVMLRIVGDLNFEDNTDHSDNDVSRGHLTLMDLLKSLSSFQRIWLNIYFPNAKLFEEDEDQRGTLEHKSSSLSSSKDDANDIIGEFSLYNDGIMSNIAKRLECFKPDMKYHIQRHECQLPVIEVKGYKVTSNFVSLFGALLRKYDDFVPTHADKKEIAFVPLYFLCRVLNDMHRTCNADITEKRLFIWFYYISGVREFGFDLQFVVPFLERSERCYYGLRAMKFEGEAHDRLDKEMVKLEEKIYEIKYKIEELKGYKQRHKPGKISEESSVMKEVFNDAMKLKYKMADEGQVEVDR